MESKRIYIDTSVIGGCFDEEFSEYSNLLFDSFMSGLHKPVISDMVIAELEDAPNDIKNKILDCENIEVITIDEVIKSLSKLYLQEDIISEKFANDGVHIAAATISKVDVLVSWNFKHIVNLDRIYKFNAVNLKQGYNSLEIRTPREVIEND